MDLPRVLRCALSLVPVDDIERDASEHRVAGMLPAPAAASVVGTSVPAEMDADEEICEESD